MASSFLRFLDHTQRRTTVGRTPPDEWSARPRDLYLTTHNTHSRQTSMPLVGFEPPISASERPQTYAFDRADTGTGTAWLVYCNISHCVAKRVHKIIIGRRPLVFRFKCPLHVSRHYLYNHNASLKLPLLSVQLHTPRSRIPTKWYFSFIKPTYVHLTYTTMKCLVYPTCLCPV